MDEKNIKLIRELINLIGDEVKANLVMFVRIIANPKDFICSRNHTEPSEFLTASIFAFFVIVMLFLINIPINRQLGVDVESVSYFIIYTVFSYGILFLVGVCFHISSRIVMGKGSLQSSLVVFLYMTAYLPIMLLIGYPYSFAFDENLLGSQDLYNTESMALLYGRVISSPLLIASALLYMIFTFYYCLKFGGVFRIIHEFSLFRGLAAITFGFILWVIVDIVVSIPISYSIINSFR